MTVEAMLIDHEVDPDKAIGTFEFLALPRCWPTDIRCSGPWASHLSGGFRFFEPVELPRNALLGAQTPRIRLYAREVDLED